MVLLVFFLQAPQDRDRVLDRRLVDHHRLEPAGQSCVLFHMLAVLVERGCADAVQLAARKRRLQQVGGIHRPIRLAGADQRVHFVDEQDDFAVFRLHFVENGLQPLLEFAAELCARDQRAHVERHQLLVFKALRHVAIDDAQRQTLGDRRLADAGLTDQHRIVLGAARQNLDGAADFVVAADDRVELAFAGIRGQVTRIFLQGIEAGFGIGTVGRAALADVVDDLIEPARRHARLRQDAGGRSRSLDDQRQQQALHGDEAIAGLLGGLFGSRKDARERLRQGERTIASGNLRQLGKRRIIGHPGRFDVAAGPLDQRCRHALIVVEQNFQDVFGRELGMTLRQRVGLSRLQETAHALGVFFDIHLSTSVIGQPVPGTADSWDEAP